MANLQFHYLTPVDKEHVLVIDLYGEIGPESIEIFKDKLSGLLNNFTQNVLIFNLNDLSYINSEGIGLIMNLINKATEAKREIILSGLEGEVKDVIELIGLQKIAKTFRHLGEALDAIA